ncbi:MAG: class I SAM-dependent methyltransferase [bacterium]|nr:class I SAM-dependent methyltransferase [bacterium]
MVESDFDEKAQEWDVAARIERAEAVAAQLAKQVPLDASMTAMDFGCGTGLLGFALLPRIGQLTLADPSSGMLDEARCKIRDDDAHRVSTLVLDPECTAFPNRYDLIMSLMTLHHIPDAEKVVWILAGSLKPGGALAIADLDLEDGSYHGPESEVHHGIDRALIRTWMGEAGLMDVQESTPWVMLQNSEGRDGEYPVFLVTGLCSAE